MNIRESYCACTVVFMNLNPDNFGRKRVARDVDADLVAKKTRGLNSVLTLQNSIQLLETEHGVERRWSQQHTEWIKAEKSLQECDYEAAVDHLEGLIVARLFELGKMNKAKTGMFHLPPSLITQQLISLRVQTMKADRKGLES